MPRNVELRGDWLHFRMSHKGRLHKETLEIFHGGSVADKKAALALAEEKARDLRRRVLDGSYAQRRVEDLGKESVADLIAAFETWAKGTTMEARTIRDYRNVATKFARHFFPGRALDKLHINELYTADTVRDWVIWKISQVKERIAAGDDFAGSEDPFYSAQHAAAADIRQFKGIWSIKAMESRPYRELFFDEAGIAAMKKAKVRSPEAEPFRQPSHTIRTSYSRLFDIAERRRPLLWVAGVLTGVIGLRRGDATVARWEYFRDSVEDCLQPDGSYTRQRVVYYNWKGNYEKRTKRGATEALLKPEIYDRLLMHKREGCPYVIPLDDREERNKLYDRIARVLVGIGVTDPRPIHWMRKYVGAQYATLCGIEAAAKQLGHRDIKTTMRIYSAMLNKSRAVSLI